ncbi:hypothetical protein MKX03_012428, partial [Papaver bracteatum]
MDAIRNNSWIFLCVVCFSFAMCSEPHHIIAADTISSGDSLTGNQTIISKGDRFVLGFFRPGTSPNYYIGIWYSYNRVSVQTVVWVANRDAPILDPSSSMLTLLDGNLVLLGGFSNTPIWSTNLASRTLNTTQVVLGDDGNLVLRDGFDYPAYTWLPGGKIGSREDPAMGLYSFESGPSGTSQYALYWNNSIIYWNSGEWHEKSKIFVSAPEMRLNYIFNYSCVSNVNESYFTYSLYNNSIISRLVMDFTGRIQQLTWSQTTQRWDLFWSVPKRLCEAFGNCGPFGYCNLDTWSCECFPGFVPRSPPDWSLQDSAGGCVRSTPLQCGSKDTFSPVPVSNLPIPRFDQRMLTAEICKSACKDTCSCYAYAFDYGCQLWEDGGTINFNNITSSRTPQLFYLRRAATKIYSLSPVSSSLEPVSTFE